MQRLPERCLTSAPRQPGNPSNLREIVSAAAGFAAWFRETITCWPSATSTHQQDDQSWLDHLPTRRRTSGPQPAHCVSAGQESGNAPVLRAISPPLKRNGPLRAAKPARRATAQTVRVPDHSRKRDRYGARSPHAGASGWRQNELRFAPQCSRRHLRFVDRDTARRGMSSAIAAKNFASQETTTS